jgi:hypothetical protein
MPNGFKGESRAASSGVPLLRVPLVPQALLRENDCYISTDTRYRAAARLRQSLWRHDQNLPLGGLRPRDQPEAAPLPLGSRIDEDAGRRGGNFISRAVHALVRREVALCEDGALIETERLTTNLLSSTALVFNLLGPLALDPELATAVFRSLLPGFVHAVEEIRFETSPGRGDPRFLGDATASDAAIEIITPDGEPGTVFIEAKYTEGLSGPAAPARPRYDEVSREVGLFINADSPVLRTRGVEQFWRLHMLAGLAVRHGVTPRALFITISPAQNRRVAAALTLFMAELADPVPTSDNQIGFTALTLEAVVAAIASCGDTQSAAYIRDRYLDLQPVLDLVLSDDLGPPRDVRALPFVAIPAPVHSG